MKRIKKNRMELKICKKCPIYRACSYAHIPYLECRYKYMDYEEKEAEEQDDI